MKLAGAVLSPVLTAIGLVSKKPKPQALPAPLPTPTRDDARAIVEQNDDLARRRGGAADIVNGPAGVAPPSGGKATLGS